MVSISQVYNSVKDIVNKEQKGFITPTSFNSLAVIAQTKIFNELMDEFIEGRKLSRQNLDNVNTYSYVRRKQEDLSNFINEVQLTGTNERYDKPVDMVKLISIAVNYTLDVGDSDDSDIEIVHDPEMFSHIMKSNLSSPTGNYRVAFVDSSTINIYPIDSLDSMRVKYFRKPGSVLYDGSYSGLSPYYAVTSQSGVEFENAEATRNFMLPPHYLPELVAEICEMVGVRLRDRDVQSFGQQKSAEQ